MVDAVTVGSAHDVLACLDEVEDGVVYEYQSDDGVLYVKLSRVGGQKRLRVGVATPGSYSGAIMPDPVTHAEKVGEHDAADQLTALLDATGQRQDIEGVSSHTFGLEGVHSRYHDVRRAYFETTLRKPVDV